MVIKENMNANYLAHYKTKGAKNGIRRYQSYMVAPNPSGATGQEVGEAAEQRERISGHDDENDDRRKENLQRLQERVNPSKKTAADRIQDKRKKKWAKSYKSLYRHADEFTNKELSDAIDRLDLKDKIKNKSLSSMARNTRDGSDILFNLAKGSSSFLSLYNAFAVGANAYNMYTGKKDKKGNLPKKFPTIDTRLLGLSGGGGGDNKKKNKGGKK